MPAAVINLRQPRSDHELRGSGRKVQNRSSDEDFGDFHASCAEGGLESVDNLGIPILACAFHEDVAGLECRDGFAIRTIADHGVKGVRDAMMRDSSGMSSALVG